MKRVGVKRVGGFDLEYLDHEDYSTKRELKKFSDFVFLKPVDHINLFNPYYFSYS